MARRNLVALLSICLSIAVLLSASASCLPGFLTQAHKVSQSVVEKRTAQPAIVEADGMKSFIIQMAGDTATCRATTPDEVALTVPSPDNRGVSVDELLQPKNRTLNAREPSDNLTINLLALSQLENDPNRTTVIAAFQRAAAIWTNRIKSPVIIDLKIDYGANGPNGAAFPSGVVGATSSGSLAVDYASARHNLIAGASSSAEAAIYNSLPANSIPVDTGDGSVVEVTRSLAQALGIVALNPDEVVATISFNKGFAFDFDPDNGIDSDKLDFVAVAAHEIGHSLGFISSNGEGSAAPVTSWDIFRFRPGMTPETFPTAQRIMSTGGAQVFYTTQGFVLGGGATNELGLSTGGPVAGVAGDGRQSSHWKADELSGNYIGIMDPSISNGVHQLTTENDFSALEILGWNLVSAVSPPSPLPPVNYDNFGNGRVIVGCAGTIRGSNLNATKETSEPNHSPDANGGTHSVWYSWRAPSTGSATFTTAGSNFDTVLAVYSGSSVNTLSPIVKNDDIPDVPGQPHQTTSSVTFPADAGSVYQIAVDGYNNGNAGGDMGPLKLNWTEGSCTEPTPSVLTEESLTQAVAIDSVTFVRGPFRVMTSVNFSGDLHTRVLLFTSAVGLFQPDASILTVQAGGMNLPVENVGQFFGVSGPETSYIVVRLPDGLQTGALPVTVTLRGKTSTNAAMITIAP